MFFAARRREDWAVRVSVPFPGREGGGGGGGRGGEEDKQKGQRPLGCLSEFPEMSLAKFLDAS